MDTPSKHKFKLQDIQDAQNRIKNYVLCTPVIVSFNRFYKKNYIINKKNNLFLGQSGKNVGNSTSSHLPLIQISQSLLKNEIIHCT